MEIWWHGTALENFKGIYAKGLIANRKRKNYNQETGISNNRDLSTYGGVYFAKSLYRAYGLANTATMIRTQNEEETTQLLIGVSLDSSSKRVILDEDDIFFFIEDFCFKRLSVFIESHKGTLRTFEDINFRPQGLNDKSLRALYAGFHTPAYFTILLGYVQKFFNGVISIFEKQMTKNTYEIFKNKNVIMEVQKVLDLYLKHLVSLQLKKPSKFWPEVDRNHSFKRLKISVTRLCRLLKELFLLENSFTNLRSLDNIPLGGADIPASEGQIQIMFACSPQMTIEDLLFINPRFKNKILPLVQRELLAASKKNMP